MNLTPTAKFHGLISGITVSVMYASIVKIAALVKGLSEPGWVSVTVAAALTSIGLYKLLSLLLNISLKKSLRIRSWILGPTFMHGTWVGYFVGAAGDRRYVIERFDQDLNGLTISGRSFTDQGEPHAQWSSEAASLDIAKGRLLYAYTCDVLSRNVTMQGIGVFQLERTSVDAAPNAIAGYVADLFDGSRKPAHEEKVDNALLTWSDALAKAKDRFKT